MNPSSALLLRTLASRVRRGAIRDYNMRLFALQLSEGEGSVQALNAEFHERVIRLCFRASTGIRLHDEETCALLDTTQALATRVAESVLCA